MIKVKSKKSGLTLIEVVVSIAILSIVSTPVLSMVLTSVKTNKSSEDKQKAIYIAQKYVEKFKSEDVDSFKSEGSLGATNNEVNFRKAQDPDMPDDFAVVAEISPQTDYVFPDQQNNNNNASYKKFSDIIFDGEIVLSKKTGGNNAVAGSAIKVLNKDKEDIIPIINQNLGSLDGDKSYDLEILNGIQNNNSFDDKIAINLKETGQQQYLAKWMVERKKTPKNADVVIYMDSEAKTTINVLGYNNISDSDFNIYFAKAKDSLNKDDNIKYSFVNQKGIIKTYSNIFKLTGNYNNSSRVYKINIKVWKEQQDPQKEKPLEEVNAYKSVAQ